jgi:Transglycosylase SLT domain
MRCVLYLLALAVSLPALANPAAPPSPHVLCESAVTSASFAGRLPPRMLEAIAITESGRLDPVAGRARAWPWTINAEGEGRWFETKAEAVRAVQALQARGVRSIDVGCLQVNLMFHPAAFLSLEEAFDPRANARYAAKFLNELYAASHDWSRAIASYHSETPALGEAYRLAVMARWQHPALTPLARPGSLREAAYRAFADPGTVYAAFAPSGAYGGSSPPAYRR